MKKAFQLPSSENFAEAPSRDAFDKINTTMRENSSVDLLEYVAKLLLYDDIIRHITTISFGRAIDESQGLVQILRDVLPDLETCINSAGKDNIGNSNLKMVHKIVNQHQPEKASISKLHRSDEKRLCFEAAFLLLFSNREEADESKIRTISAFLQRYPEFKDDAMIDIAEQEKLLKFRNMMKLAQIFIPAKNHKEHLMDLVTRLVEGKDQKYVTGSGEKPATRRRVLIYEREGGIRPVPRPPRLNVNNVTATSSSTLPSSSSAATIVLNRDQDREAGVVLTNAEDKLIINQDQVRDQITGRKRKDCEKIESLEEIILSHGNEEKKNQDNLLAFKNMPSTMKNSQIIPMAPKLHFIQGCINIKKELHSQPYSEYYLKDSMLHNNGGHQRYHLLTPQTETLSSLLNQHDDHNFIEENLKEIKRQEI